jgi:hypothetical protein
MKAVQSFKLRFLLAGFLAGFLVAGGGQIASAEFVFGTPTKFGPPMNSSYVDSLDCVSADGLELYLDSRRPGGVGDFDLWVAKRDTTDADWGEPVNLGPAVNSAAADTYACISQDGLELYFNSENRPGGYGGWDIWVTRRATKDAGWGPPVNLGPTVNGPAEDAAPWVSADGLELYFMVGKYGTAGQGGGASICVTRRDTKNDPWGTPVRLGSTINSSVYQGLPCLSANGLSLFFSDAYPTGPFRPGGFGGEDIWVTTRATTDDEWAIPRNLGRPVNSSLNEDSPRLSPDGSTLYFNRGTDFYVFDIWRAPIVPIVDFNGDQKVDLKDFCRLAQYWGQDESSVDIGPNPLGDGTVDIQDMVVLAKYWLKEVLPLELVAYWKLDETEGNLAQDIVADKDGTLHGEPVWQPAGGKVNGALQLDGADDYISTPLVLDPAAGAFSVFAWVKGGAPGQVIVSQTGGANWLVAGTSQGKLMTELKAAGRFGTPLFSEAVIIDGDWHRVGLTWDGTNRTLFVDNVEVAKGTQGTLAGSTGGLYIGAGKSLEAGSFWSGLIDDIKIYDRAVTP